MVEIRLHGSPGVVLHGGRLQALSAREAALLAWLQAEGPTTRARVAGLLWPGGTESQARANLRQMLARLRRAAGGVVAESDGVLQLDSAVALAPPSSLPLLGELALDDAPEFAQWLGGRREAMLRDRVRDRLAAGREALARLDLDASLAAADAVLATHAENEEAWRLRMEAFALRGDRASALQAWDECRLAVRAAFGVAPSSVTQALGERLLEGTASSLAHASLPAGLRRPGRMVGRDAALSQSLHSLALGHVLLVEGHAGIGKTRMLQEIAARVEGTAVASARPGDAARPGATLARLLGGLQQRFGAPAGNAIHADLARWGGTAPGESPLPELKSAGEHQRVLASLAKAMEAWHGAGLRAVVVDDVQFADAASLDALAFVMGEWLASDEAPHPLLLLGARPDEVSKAGMALVEAAAQARRLARIRLEPLGTDEIGQLLDGLAIASGERVGALASALHSRVGGNPAYLLESLKSLWAERGEGAVDAWREDDALPIPANAQEVMRRRLARLPGPAMQLAQLAAVAESDFSCSLAAAIAGRSTIELAPALAQLVEAQVFDGQKFAHDLIAQSVAESLPPVLKRELHGQVAACLIGVQGEASSIADHLDRAGSPRAAAPWHEKAAWQMRARWQMREAAEVFERAAARFDPAQDRAAALESWRQAARCWLVLSCHDEGLRATDEAGRHVKTARDSVLVRGIRVPLLFNASRFAEAAEGAEQLVGELASHLTELDADETAQVLLGAALGAPHLAHPEVLLQTCEVLRPRAQNHPVLAARVAMATAFTLGWMARPNEAAPLLEQAAAIAVANDIRGELLNVRNQMIRCREMQGNMPAALSACDEVQQAIRDAGAGAGFESDLAGQRRLLLVAGGRAAEALAGIDPQRPAEPGYARVRLAAVLLACGQVDAAARQFDDETVVAQRATPLAAHTAWVRARIAQAQGADAGEWLGQIDISVFARGGQLWLRHEMLRCLLGDSSGLQEFEGLAALARERGLLGLERAACAGLARRAAVAGDRESAVAYAQRGLDLAAHVDPWIDEAGSVWLTCALALRDCGEASRAADCAARGARWVIDAGMALPEPARSDWMHGNPVHRALLAFSEPEKRTPRPLGPGGNMLVAGRRAGPAHPGGGGDSEESG